MLQPNWVFTQVFSRLPFRSAEAVEKMYIDQTRTVTMNSVVSLLEAYELLTTTILINWQCCGEKCAVNGRWFMCELIQTCVFSLGIRKVSKGTVQLKSRIRIQCHSVYWLREFNVIKSRKVWRKFSIAVTVSYFGSVSLSVKQLNQEIWLIPVSAGPCTAWQYPWRPFLLLWNNNCLSYSAWSMRLENSKWTKATADRCSCLANYCWRIQIRYMIEETWKICAILIR